MPHFSYKVRDKQGRERQDTGEAATEEELIVKLQNEGLLVISVSREETVERKVSPAQRLHGRVTIDDLLIFARQLGTMLDAGVTLLRSLDVLIKQIESRVLLKAVQEIRHNVAEGSTFSNALAKHPKIFDEFWVHVTETGEASGALPVAFTQLADHLESSAAMRRKVTSALIYPSLLIVMAIVAMTVFTVWIIPIFAEVFKTFDTQLPILTTAVINISNIMRRYILIWAAMIGGLIYLVNKYIRTEKGKWQFDRLKFKIPILSSLFQRIAIERFASGLGTLIESGVPIVYALDIVGKATGNKVVEQAMKDVKESVRQGKGMTRPLEESNVFTPLVVQMVSIGEEIGELSKMLNRVSEFYKERISTTLSKITTLIEPTILVFMGVVVGILVIAMFLPIFQIATIH